MTRLFLGNFSFEESLSGKRQELPMGIRRLEAELAAVWLAVAQPGDWIWTPQPIDEDFPRLTTALGLSDVRVVSQVSQIPAGLQLVPWGCSEDARQFVAACNAWIDAPAADVVRTANSRHYSSQLEQELGVGLPGSACANEVRQLRESLAGFDAGQRWVVKAEFGAAGRNRVLGHGPLTAPQQRWIEERLRGGGLVFLEPWLEPLDEVGSQWDVARDGQPELLGLTRLITDRSGNYLGSEFGLDDAVIDSWSDAIECARRAALDLQQRGYFGPLGVDAMRYRDASGEIHVRPLQDINARWTMGRLALGWRRIAPRGIWRHGRRDVARINADIIETSPRIAGGEPVRHQTWIELPPSSLWYRPLTTSNFLNPES